MDLLKIIHIFFCFSGLFVFQEIKGTRDTIGRHFVLSLPVCSIHTRPTLLVIPQSDNMCEVTFISQTHELSTTIRPKQFQRYTLKCGKHAWNKTSIIDGRIKASCDVQAWIEYPTDTYLLYPNDVASNHFILVYPSHSNFQMDLDFTYFAVITATKEKNVIEINPGVSKCPLDLNDFDSRILLVNNQTFYLRSKCNLSGMSISTSKGEINVLVGLTSRDGRVVIADHALPVIAWGRHFIVPKLCENGNECITVFNFIGKSTTTTVRVIGDTEEELNSTTGYLAFKSSKITNVKELKANVSVIVSLATETKHNNTTSYMFHILTSTSLCMPRLYFSHLFSHRLEFSLWGEHGHALDIRHPQMSLNNSKQFSNETFFYYDALPFEGKELLVKNSETENRIPRVCGMIRERTYNSSVSRLYFLGHRITHLYESCDPKQPPVHVNGEDDDCDGLVDEEIPNKADDDDDSLIDEDIGLYIHVHQETLYRNSEGIGASTVSVIISIVVAVLAIISFIAGMIVFDQFFGKKVRPTRVSPMLE